jgi:lactate dehydrogenase-like 2-hydroxyacid dehydrogenase
MRILYTKRTRLPAEEEVESGLTFVNLDELLVQSDFVCVEASYNARHQESQSPRRRMCRWHCANWTTSF